MSIFYEKGREAVFQALGVEKTAALPGAGALRSAGKWMRGKMPTARTAREFLIGNPRQFAEELSAGKALGKGGLLRKSFEAKNPATKALLYGVPLAEAGTIAMDPEGRKAQRLGETLGGATLGLAAWRPFGIMGSMAADTLGRRLGGAVGQTADYARRGGAPEPVRPASSGPASTTPTFTPAANAIGRAVDYSSDRVTR
jgi:hypothetical protein